MRHPFHQVQVSCHEEYYSICENCCIMSSDNNPDELSSVWAGRLKFNTRKSALQTGGALF